jgi:hypothetical protein
VSACLFSDSHGELPFTPLDFLCTDPVSPFAFSFEEILIPGSSSPQLVPNPLEAFSRDLARDIKERKQNLTSRVQSPHLATSSGGRVFGSLPSDSRHRLYEPLGTG